MTYQLTLHQINSEMQHCMQNCLDCHSICLNTITYCLQQGGRHPEIDRIRLMLNCAEICQTCADFMLTGSHFHTRTCEVCAEICEHCAQDCERMGDDAQMKACPKCAVNALSPAVRCPWRWHKIKINCMEEKMQQFLFPIVDGGSNSDNYPYGN